VKKCSKKSVRKKHRCGPMLPPGHPVCCKRFFPGNGIKTSGKIRAADFYDYYDLLRLICANHNNQRHPQAMFFKLTLYIIKKASGKRLWD